MKKLRIFRYCKSEGKYTYFDAEGSVYVKERIRTENGGVKRCTEGSVRIMAKEKPDICPGDYLSLEKNEAPSKDTDWLITAVIDNCRGTLAHVRLIMEVVA